MQAGADTATKGLRDSAGEKLKTGNAAGAVADLTEALRSNPTGLPLYRERGDAKRAAGDLDGAIADYCTAAETNLAVIAANGGAPDYLRDAILGRGRDRLAKGDAAGAQSDLRMFLQISTAHANEMILRRDFTGAVTELDQLCLAFPAANLFALRADARWGLRDWTAAEADYIRVLEPFPPGAAEAIGNPKVLRAECRYKRGHLRRWRGDLAGAEEDFRAALPDLGNSPGLSRGRATLWLYLLQTEMGRKDAALAELAAADQSGWEKPEVVEAKVMLGRIDGAEMIRDVGFPGGGTVFLASFYSALNHRISGDDKVAIDRFRRALATGAREEGIACELEEARRQVTKAGFAVP
jgi:tetratricopeptide (TPR) repeat protein